MELFPIVRISTNMFRESEEKGYAKKLNIN